MQIRYVVAVQLLILTTLVGLAELFLWKVLPVSLDDPSVKLPFSQNIDGVKTNIVYERNSHGLRSEWSWNETKERETFRILCLGASTTDQSTQNTEDTWCAILAHQLNKVFAQTNKRIESASMGRGGWRAVDTLVWSMQEIDRYNPDLVIVLVGINDLTWNGGPNYSYVGLGAKAREILDARYSEANKTGGSVKEFCLSFSQLCRRGLLAKQRVVHLLNVWSGNSLEWHSEKLPQRRREYRTLPYRESVERVTDPFREFSESTDALVSLLQDKRIDVLLLGQPVLWKESMSVAEQNALWFSVNTVEGPVRPSGLWLAAEMSKYNNRLKQLAHAHEVSYLALDTVIPKTLDYYFDDCHYTDKGSRAVAAAITPLVQAGLFSELDPNDQ